MQENQDPMGMAIADYWKNGKAERLRVFSPDFDEDEIPVDVLFRNYADMPRIEQKALDLAEGRILDVGAGAGCHSLALQDKGKDVIAIDISPLSVRIMGERGVEKARLQDFWETTERFDTILMLMNGIGIIGKVGNLGKFFSHIDEILAQEGQLLLDSSDIAYVFETDEGIIELPPGDGYYGELEYQMQYKDIKGDCFSWLYLDAETLATAADVAGFRCEIIEEGEHYEFLARITRK